MDWSYEIRMYETAILNAEQIIKDDTEYISKLEKARKGLEERIATSKEKINFLKSLNPYINLGPENQ